MYNATQVLSLHKQNNTTKFGIVFRYAKKIQL